MNSRFRELLRNNVVDIAYYMCLHKGGKGATVSAQPIVAPSAPIDDASYSYQKMIMRVQLKEVKRG